MNDAMVSRETAWTFGQIDGDTDGRTVAGLGWPVLTEVSLQPLGWPIAVAATSTDEETYE